MKKKWPVFKGSSYFAIKVLGKGKRHAEKYIEKEINKRESFQRSQEVKALCNVSMK